MSVSNKRKYSFLALIVFVVSPLLSLPFTLLSIYNKERFGLFVLALFGGVLSYSILPTWQLDLSRYYLLYQEISTYGFTGFLDVVGESNDYVFFFVYYIASTLKISFQYLLLILSVISFYTSFVVFDKLLVKYKLPNYLYLLLLITFILSVPVLSLISVTRFSMGYTFFIVSVYFNLINKNKKSLLFLIISCLTHFAYLVYVPFILIFSIFKDKKKINFLLSILTVGVFILNAMGGILRYAQHIPIISTKMVTYSTIYEGTTLPVLSYSLLIPVLISVVFYFLYSKYIPEKFLRAFLTALVVVLFTIPFNLIIYDRYIQVFKPILLIVISATLVQVFHLVKKKFQLTIILITLNLPFVLYYLYTFYVVYRSSLSGFLSVNKLLLISILSDSYSHYDFL